MSPRTVELMRTMVSRHLFIPVTSRSIEQYRRIEFPPECVPEWAVTTNGAFLLRHGQPDAAWQADAAALIAPWQPELQRLHDRLADDPRFIRCRIVDEAYLFVYCGRNAAPDKVAGELAGRTDLTVMVSGKKIYLLPPALNKATALERLKSRFACSVTICAGDSEMDLPMLNAADHAIMPEELAKVWKGYGTALVCPSGTLFSEFVFSRGLELMSEPNGRHQDGSI